MCRERVLLLDDLGKGRVTPRVESELFGLLDTRFHHNRATIITSNQNGAGLENQFSPDIGPPLVRRIREFSLIVGMKKGKA